MTIETLTKCSQTTCQSFGLASYVRGEALGKWFERQTRDQIVAVSRKVFRTYASVIAFAYHRPTQEVGILHLRLGWTEAPRIGLLWELSGRQSPRTSAVKPGDIYGGKIMSPYSSKTHKAYARALSLSRCSC